MTDEVIGELSRMEARWDSICVGPHEMVVKEYRNGDELAKVRSG